MGVEGGLEQSKKSLVDILQEKVAKDATKEQETFLGGILGPKFDELMNKVNNVITALTGKKIEEDDQTTADIVEEKPEKKDENKKPEIQNYNEKDLEQTIVYLTHQQGARGIKEIIHAATSGEPLPKDIMKNMANNVNLKEFNDMFGMNVASKQELEKSIGAKDFLQYWNKKFLDKKNTYVDNHKYDDIIDPLAQKYGVDPDFVRITIGIESGFDPKAGNANYKGLMSIGAEEAERYGFDPADRMDAAKNIEMGVRLLAEHDDAMSKQVQLAKDNYATIMTPQSPDLANAA